jgi:hypothetical protein
VFSCIWRRWDDPWDDLGRSPRAAELARETRVPEGAIARVLAEPEREELPPALWYVDRIRAYEVLRRAQGSGRHGLRPPPSPLVFASRRTTASSPQALWAECHETRALASRFERELPRSRGEVARRSVPAARTRFRVAVRSLAYGLHEGLGGASFCALGFRNPGFERSGFGATVAEGAERALGATDSTGGASIQGLGGEATGAQITAYPCERTIRSQRMTGFRRGLAMPRSRDGVVLVVLLRLGLGIVGFSFFLGFSVSVVARTHHGCAFDRARKQPRPQVKVFFGRRARPARRVAAHLKARLATAATAAPASGLCVAALLVALGGMGALLLLTRGFPLVSSIVVGLRGVKSWFQKCCSVPDCGLASGIPRLSNQL